MANYSNSRPLYTADEVLNLLEAQSLCDEESQRMAHLSISDDESDGCNDIIGGYVAEDGTDQDVPPGYLRPAPQILFSK